jgi:processive 1,2-diacylglycerol beta-glucosyltransferase
MITRDFPSVAPVDTFLYVLTAMGKQKIAVFSVSAGTGHLRAAEALTATAPARFPGLEVIHIDLMTLVPPLFRELYAGSYLPLVERHPALWGYLYDVSDRPRRGPHPDRLRIAVERLNTQKLKEVVRDLNPDAVICTHFLPAELFSRWRRKRSFTRPVWLVVTDFDVHMLWVQANVSGYCTAAEEVAWRLQDRGVDPGIVHVTGIPIMPAFGDRLSRRTCAAELGLDHRRRTLLVMAGGAGLGGILKMVRRLLQIRENFQIIALAGRNLRMLSELQRVARNHPGRLFPLAFTPTIERVMRVSDLAITKPGGLTTSECLAMGLPMVVVNPIPGQEERNADFLLEHGVALKAYDETGLEFRVRALLGDTWRLAEMSRKARSLGRPDAAADILNIALESAGLRGSTST